MAKGVELAKGFTVGHYLAAVAKHDDDAKSVIADAIHRRFKERYIEPVSSNEPRHGFTMMAVGCLMIEALESFRQGWPDTRGRGQGRAAFCFFFDRHNKFAPFRGHGSEFYDGVRCGILHQAETTLGWRILRTGRLLSLDLGTRTVNAKRFLDALSAVLDGYRDELKATGWEDEIWRSLRTKMKRVCENCEPRKVTD